jgi:hypothetical protein
MTLVLRLSPHFADIVVVRLEHRVRFFGEHLDLAETEQMVVVADRSVVFHQNGEAVSTGPTA